jgi:hypothetical protein
VQNFSNFWTALKASEFVKSQEETDIVKWTFKDGTELEVKQEEHSVSSSCLVVLCGVVLIWKIDHQPLHHLQRHHRQA